MTLSEKFFNNFGEWSCAEACKINDLPFASDIKRFLDAYEQTNEQNIPTDACSICFEPRKGRDRWCGNDPSFPHGAT